MNTFRNRPILLSLAIAALLAAPVWAQFTTGSQSVQLNGVDQSGNPSASLGATVNGKVYSDPTTGIIIVTGSGRVSNLSRKVAVFMNIGVSITDPVSGDSVTSTSDVELVAPVFFGTRARAALAAVYNPGLAL